ncbi:MAG TPA: hypothetical protein VFS35_02055 [Terrimicrobiaceae bacterium]|nr:hypothetical protein [Terrimicrobiaceae bacterium]
MRARSLALWVVAVIGAFALFATPAEAGGKRHRHYNDNCYRGGGGYGYYQPYYRNYGNGYYRPYYRNYYRPVRYYQPVFYPPVFQIGFAFGGGGYCR